jgi:hypothetical protein
VVDTTFVPIPGVMTPPLKRGSQQAKEKDKEYRKIETELVKSIKSTNAAADRLAAGDLIGVTVRLADSHAVKAKILSDLNLARIRLQNAPSTVEAILPVVTEKLLRKGQEQRLHNSAERAKETREIAQEGYFFLQGGEGLGVAAPTFLPVAIRPPVAPATDSDGVAFGATVVGQTRRTGRPGRIQQHG